jgi:hypothetical protein
MPTLGTTLWEIFTQKPASNVTANMARQFGLRPGHPLDEKLARAIANPRSRCVEKYVYSRGLCAIYVAGMYLRSVGHDGTGKIWLLDLADEMPELPHLKQWAEKL